MFTEDEKKKQQQKISEGVDKAFQIEKRSSFNTTPIQTPTVTPTQTSRQKILSQPIQEQKWQGTVPTNSEMLAKIYDVSKTDQQKASTMLDMYNYLSNDPSSAFYSPYRQATNQKAITNLQALGVDVSGGITNEWFQKNKNLLAGARYTTTGMIPAAPAKGSTPENDAAYWYYTLMQDEERTQKAETEWKALQEEISYWANRADLNLSDQEILGRIKWSDYKTLVDMDEAKSKGIPMQLNRGVGYSQDNLYGVIWAARNQSDKTDMTLNAMNYRLGIGNSYVENPEIRKYLNPDLDTYNPFKIKATIDDAAEYFGVDSFDSDWVHDHQYMRGSMDATEARMYDKVVKAEQNTVAAENELAEMNKYIDDAIKSGLSYDEITSDLLEGFPTLTKLNASLASSDLLDTTRPIDFDMNEIKDRIQRETQGRRTAQSESHDYNLETLDLVGALTDTTSKVIENAQNSDNSKPYNPTDKPTKRARNTTTETNQQIVEGHDKTLQQAAPVVAEVGTLNEKIYFRTAPTTNLVGEVQTLQEGVRNGTISPESAYEISMGYANQYVIENYAGAYLTKKRHEDYIKEYVRNSERIVELQKDSPDEMPKNYFEAMMAAPDEELLNLQQRNAEIEKVLKRDSNKYADSKEILSICDKVYEIPTRLAKYLGTDTTAITNAKENIQTLMSFDDQYVLNVQSSHAVQEMEKAGISRKEIRKNEDERIKNDREFIADLTSLEKYAVDNHIELNDNIRRNLQSTRKDVEYDMQFCVYDQLRDNEDFDQVVAEEKKRLKDEYGVDGILDWGANRFKDDTAEMKAIVAAGVNSRMMWNPMMGDAIATYAGLMGTFNESERDVFLYLYSKNREEAQKYYDFMTDSERGIINTRQGEKMAEMMSNVKTENFGDAVVNTLTTILMKPVELAGTGYAVGQMLTGKQINPNHYAFAMSDAIQNIRNESKETISNKCSLKIGDMDVGKSLAEFMYDAISSAGDSAYSALLTGTFFGRGQLFAGKALEIGGHTFDWGSWLNSAARASLQSSYAIGSSARNVASLGGSEQQAILMAAVSFGAELITESIEVSDMYEMATAKDAQEVFNRGLLKLLQVNDAAGEAFSSIIEKAGDQFIMGELSDYSRKVDAYKDLGLSEEEAQKRAIFDTVQDVLMEGLMGGVSAGFSEGMSYAIGSTFSRISNKVKKVKPGTVTWDQRPVSSTDLTTSSTDSTTSSTNTTASSTDTTTDQRKQLVANQITLLGRAGESNSVSTKTATIAAVLNGSDQPSDTLNIATASAQQIMDDYGEDAIGGLQNLILTAAENGIDDAHLRTAISMAALSTGSSHDLLGGMLTNQGQINADTINQLVESTVEDINNDVVMDEINAKLYDHLTTGNVISLIGQGALSGIESYRVGADQAKANVNDAKQKLDTAQSEMEASTQNLQMAESEFLQDAGNDQKKGAYQQALKDAEGKAIVLSQMEAAVDSAVEKFNAAVKILNDKVNETITQVRENARQMTDDQMVRQQEQKAQEEVQQAQEEAVRQQAQEDARRDSNAANLSADDFIAQYYPDATEDEKQEIRNRFQQQVTEAQDPEKQALRNQFINQIAKKFGVNIHVRDTTNGGTTLGYNGSYNRDTNTIELDFGTTDSDILYTVAMHELTHMAESSGMYNSLAESLTRLAYSNDDGTYDENQLASDIRARQQMYNSQLPIMKAMDPSINATELSEEDAAKEVVADLTRRILYGDEQLIRNFIANDPSMGERFFGWMKSIGNKFNGVNDPAVTQMNKTRDLFEKTLKNAAKQQAITRERVARDMPVNNNQDTQQFSVVQLAEANNLTVEMAPEDNWFEIEYTDANGKLRTASSPYRLLDSQGNVVTQVTPDMIRSTPMGFLIDAAVRNPKSPVTKEIADKQLKMFADLSTMAARYGGDTAMVWEIASAAMFSSIKNNSDDQYSTTVDYGTICAKTQAIVDVMSQRMLEKGRGLTRNEIIDIYNEVANEGLAVPCPVCYVFSRWMGVPSLLDRMANYQDRFGKMSEQEVMDYIKRTQDENNPEGNLPVNEINKKINEKKTSIQGKLNRMKENERNLRASIYALDDEIKRAKTLKDVEELNAQIDELEKKLADYDAYNWVTQVLCKESDKGNYDYVLDPDYKPVPKDILFDLNNTGAFAAGYKKSWRYRNTRGAGMGKSIMPYSGAQLGDVIKSRSGDAQGRWKLSENPIFKSNKRQTSQLISNTIKRMKAQNLIGGQRFQSTSDYRPEWGLDYVMTFLEMQAVGAKAQLYTKVLEAVDLFAHVGAEVNLSLMGKGKGWHEASEQEIKENKAVRFTDQNGNTRHIVLDFSDITGVKADKAREYINKYDNVQGILVGLNDEHILAAMASDWVNFIIPWHASGNSKGVLASMLSAVGETLDTSEAHNYEDSQNDKLIDEDNSPVWDVRMKLLTGKYWKKGKINISEADQNTIDQNAYLKDLFRRFYLDPSETDTYKVTLTSNQANHIFPYEYWDTNSTRDNADINGKRFVEYCESLGVIPRFSQFKDHTGYWKLLIDRSMYNNDGTYHVPQTLDVTKIQTDDIASSVDQVKYGDQEKYDKILQRIREKDILERKENLEASVPAPEYNLQTVDPIPYATEDVVDPTEEVQEESNPKIQYSLPSGDLLDQQIRQYMRRSTMPVQPVQPAQQQPSNQPQAQYARNTQPNPQNPPTGGTRPSGAPKESPQRIAKNMTDFLGVGGNFGTNTFASRATNGQGARGYYVLHKDYINVRPKDAGNYMVDMHEIGHAIAQRIGMTGTQQMINNLPSWFSQAYQPQDLPDEAFAEFVWRYMESDARGRNFAGDAFVDGFEAALKQQGLYDGLMKEVVKLRQWVNATTLEKMKTVVHDKSEKRNTPAAKKLHQIAARVVDASAAAVPMTNKIREQNGGKVDLSTDVRSQALLRNHADKRLNYILEDALTDSNGNIVGESMANCFTGLNGDEDFKLLNQYGLAKHAIDRDAQDKPVFDNETILPGDRQAFIDDIETNHSNVAEAFKKFQAFRTQFLQTWMVNTGYWSQKQLDDFNKMYPSYVPTYRVKQLESGNTGGMTQGNYVVHQATGSSEDIINPMDSFISMMNSIVKMNLTNNVGLAFHRAFSQYAGMGEFGKDITGEGYMRNRGKNAIAVQLADGSKAYYEIYDPDLYRLLAATGPAVDGAVNLLGRTIGRLTRGMSALTTGSNPVFAIRNFLRDFQNSVNYGSWASNYFTGLLKWASAFAEVWSGKSDDYQNYKALGGGGWTRINPSDAKSAQEVREMLFPGYGKKGVKNRVRNAANTVWSLVTMEKLNEAVEQASRFAEYKYGKHDRNTEEGRQEAFLAAQEATVDFSRNGNTNVLNVFSQVVPFLKASTQGVYRTGRMITDGAERSRLPARMAKTIFNTAFASAIANALVLKFSDDDEKKDLKKDFENMNDNLVSQNFFLPNVLPDVLGNRPLLRIPVGQDPIMYAVHGAVTKAMWYGTTDQDVIDIAAIANTVIDNLNPANNPVWSAWSDINRNRNWYGSKIVPTRMESNDWESSTRYTEETADIFINASRAVNSVLDRFGANSNTKNLFSPLNLQYLAEQYTGYVGQMLIPAISKNKYTGELAGINAMVTSVRNRFTTDPLVSNEVVNAFYDNSEFIDGIKAAGKNGMPMNVLRRGLTPEEALSAYESANTMTKKGGIIADTKSYITECYSEIEKINGNETLTDEQKYKLTSDIRRQMIDRCLVANQEVERLREAYVTGTDVATAALMMGAVVNIPEPTPKPTTAPGGKKKTNSQKKSKLEKKLEEKNAGMTQR